MSELNKMRSRLDLYTDEMLYDISIEDILTYVKVCEILDREDIDEVGIDAIPEILNLFESDEDWFSI